MTEDEDGSRTLGEAIKHALGSRDQGWLANQVDVTQTAVSKWIHGETMPRPDRLPRIERALGLPAGELVALAYGAPGPAPAAEEVSAALAAAMEALDAASRAVDSARAEVRRLRSFAR